MAEFPALTRRTSVRFTRGTPIDYGDSLQRLEPIMSGQRCKDRYKISLQWINSATRVPLLQRGSPEFESLIHYQCTVRSNGQDSALRRLKCAFDSHTVLQCFFGETHITLVFETRVVGWNPTGNSSLVSKQRRVF